ncbi:MAG: hypothetical protein NW208_11435 [Bryobacter sp.]|nr:hypothetical protein [Bryobacter sp.]
MRILLLFAIVLSVLGQSPAPVTVLWSPGDPAIGPYPAGERPAKLFPACRALTPDCLERTRLEALDGFATEPWLKVRFSGPVRLSSLRDHIYLVYGDVLHRDGFATYSAGNREAINQLHWDPRTFTLYAKPDHALEHGREYFLVVGRGVVDEAGQPIQADPRFREALPTPLGTDVLVFTRFRTMNVVRTLVEADLGPSGTLRLEGPGLVRLSEYQSLELLMQRSADPNAPLVREPFPVDLETIRSLGFDRLAFFSFTNSQGEAVHGHLWLPTGNAIFSPGTTVLIGHGLGDHRFAGPTFFANAFLDGAASVSINAVGHGYGPQSRLVLTRANGTILEVPFPGRGRDADGTGAIEPFDGCVLFTPGNPAFIRDCLRQTALDYRTLIRELEQGLDFDGDGAVDYQPARFQYLGQSLGAMYGSLLVATEPRIEAAVLNVGGGSTIEIARHSDSLRALLALYLSLSHPEVLTGFLQLPDPLTPRYAEIAILEDARAAHYLELLDRFQMLESDAAPASFGPFFKQATLFGHPVKPVLFQFAIGDQTAPNPANYQLIRAAFEYGNVSAYRHDRARRERPDLPANPHTYLAAFVELREETLLIGEAALLEAAQFLANPQGGVPDVNPLVRRLFKENLFEVPAFLP